MTIDKDQIFQKAVEMCDEGRHKILYLTEFGSHLYGTNTEASDTYVKGIFLPSKESLLLGETCRHLTYNSEKGDGKNSSEDVDLQLWSLHYFVHLLSIGDTNALDLLYSFTRKKCVLASWPDFRKALENNHQKFYDPRRMSGYLGYVMGQIKKYGTKGSRLGAIKCVYDWLGRQHPTVMQFKLNFWLKEIVKDCYDQSYCFEKEINREPSLVLCGKVHRGGITMIEFAQRVSKDFDRYGDRARKASENLGIDWKAVSHGVRCIVQMAQILGKGGITFPLQEAPAILEIKQGKMPWEKCEQALQSGMDTIKKQQDLFLPEDVKYDPQWVKQFILNYYR